MKIVRESSVCGPCLTQGRLVKETAQFFVYNEWLSGDRYSEKETKVKKNKVHLEPCRSCRDHEQTSYPNGYMD